MEIIIVTGQRNGNLYLAGNYEHAKYFPEQDTLHPYKLSERILELCDIYSKANEDLVIFTYSEHDLLRENKMNFTQFLRTVDFVRDMTQEQLNDYIEAYKNGEFDNHGWY